MRRRYRRCELYAHMGGYDATDAAASLPLLVGKQEAKMTNPIVVELQSCFSI